MSKKNNQHVVPHNGDWAVKGENNDKYTAITKTKAEALDKAIEIAKNQEVEVVIHDKHGVIKDKDSYGNDPSYIKDKVH